MVNKSWTPEQLSAIDTRNASLLVSAAAGAGKTAVLVERIIRLITDPENAVDVDRLLVLTFTNAAAAEMRDRVAGALNTMLKENPMEHLSRQLLLLNQAKITTIHSFCLDLLRQYFFKANIDPSFKIGDQSEVALLKNDVLEELFELKYSSGDDIFTGLVDRFGGERDDKRLADLVLGLFEYARSNPLPQLWLDSLAHFFLYPREMSFDSLPWVKEILKGITLTLEGANSCYRRASDLCRLPGGPSHYLETLEAEQQAVVAMQGACSLGWERVRKIILELEFKRLKSVKGEFDPELRERVKELRGAARKMLQEIRDVYFARDTEAFCSEMAELHPVVKGLGGLVQNFSQAYQEAKLEKNMLDFSDLEQYSVQILTQGQPGERRPSDIALEHRENFVEVLVDEYQDINPVQELILQMVSRQEENKNLFMVGDVKQSIYKFRLAEPGLFMDKLQEFKDVPGVRKMKINLSKNFRSRASVVDAVNCIFSQVMSPEAGEVLYDEGAALRLGADYLPYPLDNSSPPSMVELCLIDRANDNNDMKDVDEKGQGAIMQEALPDEEVDAIRYEARLVAGKIKALVLGGEALEHVLVYNAREGTYRRPFFRDVVVLLRSTKAWAGPFLEEFRAAGIPAYAEMTSGYFEAVEIETVLSLLRVIDNPRQDIPLAAVLRSPLVGMDAGVLAEIRLAGEAGSDFYSCLLQYVLDKTNADSPVAHGFLENLDKWRTMARRGSLADLIWQLYSETGFYQYAGSMPGGGQRQANLRALYDRARQYEVTSYRGLSRFLKFIEKLREGGGDMGTARNLGENEDVVRIMSIHKSKGLEFPVVFLAGLGKRFNLSDLSREVLVHRHLGLGPNYVDTAARISYPTLARLAVKGRLRMEMLAEEMRILYVAMTRARERLIMTGSVNNLARSAARWCRCADLTDKLLPGSEMTQAVNFLDWICPALARHPDGAPLRDKGGIAQFLCLAGELSRWKVEVTGVGNSLCSCESPYSYPELTDVCKGEPVITSGGLGTLVEDIFSWRYPDLRASYIPAKVSVTQARKMALEPWVEQGGPGQDNYLGPKEEIFAEPFRKPAFLLQRGSELSATDRGNAIHLVLQHIDWRGDTSIEGVARQISAMVEREMLGVLQVGSVNPEIIACFFQSSLGRRMRESFKVRREMPFSMAMEVEKFYPESGLPGEKIMVQGALDCLFLEADGWVVIDFKTDSSPGRGDEYLLEMYREQLDLYALAVETAMGQRVKEKYIYLLNRGKALEVK